MNRFSRFGLYVLVLILLLSGCTPAENSTSSDTKALKDGSYAVTKTGHNGPIDFEIGIEEGEIVSITVKKAYETPGVATKALETELPHRIFESQSTAVDGITGATITSNAVKKAVEDAIAQAGGDPKAYRIAQEVEEPKNVEKKADIVIVGAGGAGLAAAVTAAENGSSVIIVEKAGYVGGNTLISGGIYNTPDSDLQFKQEMTPGLERLVEDALAEKPVSDEHRTLLEEVKKDYEDYKDSGEAGIFDSAAWFALQTWNGGDKVADLKHVRTMAFKAKEGLDWLKTLGWEYRDVVNAGAGSLYPRTHMVDKPLGTGYIDAYMNRIQELGAVDIIYNTRAQELVTDGNRVVAVKGEDIKGNTYTLEANQAVILATGGFAGSQELVDEYNTSGKWPKLSNVKSSNLPAIEGDGIRMALDTGAAVRDMDQIQLLFLGNLKGPSVTKATFQPKGAEGLIYVNKEGERFVREDGRRDEISLAFLKQTDGIGYVVQCADSGIKDDQKDLGGVPVKALIEEGTVFSGDTLEEAAKQAGVNPDQLRKTVDAFNALVEQKVEEDSFGRAVFGTKLEHGPWYIVPKVPSIHHTMGGVVVNEHAQVMNTENNAIEGLYAAGEIVGGVHGANRLGGNALVDTVVFGRIAGEEASKAQIK